MQLCTHVTGCVCSNNSNCNRQNKSNTKYFNLYAEFWFLYFISTPSNHSLLRFWFYLRYKNKYMLFDFYFAKFNFLHFISTPSNHSPICVWFYLRYKNKKNYTKLSVVLSGCFESCEFPLSFSFSLFLLLLGRNLLSGYSPPNMHRPASSTSYGQAWGSLVPYIVHIVGFIGCVALFNFVGGIL